MKEAKE
jgi:hypothetical protein